MKNLVNAILNNKIFIIPLLIIFPTIFLACEKTNKMPQKKSQQPTLKLPKGLYVENGVLKKNGKPFRAVGVNYFNAFYRVLKNTNDTSYVAGFEKLAKAEIPFVRFMCCGFWPADFKLYFSDKKTYFKLLDDFVNTAEKYNVGLIPSLFWYFAAVPDLMNESMDQLGNPKSKSIAFIKKYTIEIVTRYKDSPAIWGWELGNEYNLGIDLPNASEHRPPVWPVLGTPTNRTERDELSSKHIHVVMKEFAKTVRKYDKKRIISTGNAVPPWYAYHNTLNRSWERDTVEQYKDILERDNPNPFDVISIHVYPMKDKKYAARANNVSELIKISNEFAESIGKPLFIGEFGVPNSYSNQVRKLYNEFIYAIEKYKVPLSALWVFDYENQNKMWNTTFENNRAFMLDAVSELNQKLRNEVEPE